ncbi:MULTISPECIES: ABC transporter permease [Methanolobus]|uniref:ABC-type transport system involved in multi-copper enzyme maturation, permease component n=2 Tax=Methanolobus TaxID=2220 RepID=W9DW90_METTI|nr:MULTISPECIES: ABC transporter permease [Methanolobus]ETA67962.1 ABC-type transport system involved in multi-copper enzyme maturation, permease component [Methanolobus tindarius DSM 2278]SFM50306.1 ABC-2 type transport system permease protein [Methanolobus profundi]
MNTMQSVFVISEKEFADNIWSPKLLALIVIITSSIFSRTYLSGITQNSDLLGGFLDVAKIISLFLPLVGVVLGFDAISKEKDSGALNVLLTHPVYRDTIVAGKTLGAMGTLALIVFISTITVIGARLISSGLELNSLAISRLLIFSILTYFYLSIFISFAMFSSIITNNSTNALIYNIATWLILCIAFGMIAATAASFVTDEKPLDLSDNNNFLIMNANLQQLSPSHHYLMAVSGNPSPGWSGVSSGRPEVDGIFDTKHTLHQWWNELGVNVIILIISPVFLTIITYIVFLRKDLSNVG